MAHLKASCPAKATLLSPHKSLGASRNPCPVFVVSPGKHNHRRGHWASEVIESKKIGNIFFWGGEREIERERPYDSNAT